jgi:hypothetical protein
VRRNAFILGVHKFEPRKLRKKTPANTSARLLQKGHSFSRSGMISLRCMRLEIAEKLFPIVEVRDKTSAEQTHTEIENEDEKSYDY